MANTLTAPLHEKTTKQEMLESRLLKKDEARSAKKPRPSIAYPVSTLRNTIGQGDSMDLIFTSSPYFNARQEYSDYEQYEQYLFKMRRVVKRAHRVLNDGRFFVMNTAPVLMRRASRIAVPFDLHRIFVEEGYDFIDDIIWAEPEGAGWATGCGRRFAADRNPMQYKAVPVTEYVMVYRKRADRHAPRPRSQGHISYYSL